MEGLKIYALFFYIISSDNASNSEKTEQQRLFSSRLFTISSYCVEIFNFLRDGDVKRNKDVSPVLVTEAIGVEKSKEHTKNKYQYLKRESVFIDVGTFSATSPSTALPIPCRSQHLLDRTFVDSNLITQGNPTVTASIRSLTVVVDLAFVFRISTGIDAALAVSTCVASLVERLQITENGES